MNGRPTPEMLNGILAENADNIIPTLLLNYFFDPLGVENVDAFLKNYTAYDNHPFIVTARQKVEAAKKTASGAPAPDFTMEDLQGQEKSLSSYLGKGYVLLDFWASWCAPCIHEMPTLKEAYEKYKAKGFEIISVSLDNNKAKWEGGVSRLELPWPQLSDLKGFQSVAAQLYGVRGIPAIFLISPDGKIVAKNLRGQNLLNKLAEIYD